MRITKGVAALICFSMSTQALAGQAVVHPVQIGKETARFDQGEVTLDLEGKNGVIQVSPLGWDHGGLVFSVAVYNDSDAPSNFDIDNVSVTAGSQSLTVFSREELEKKAKNRAMWTQIGLAALGGVAAAAAASQRDHYRATFVTPRGVYRSYFSAPSASGQVAAAASIGAAGVGIATVQRNLDETRAALRDEIIQRTTVDPHSFYAGRIVLDKIKSRNLPQDVRLTVRWNGEEYPFGFQVAKSGTQAPPFTALTTVKPRGENPAAAVATPSSESSSTATAPDAAAPTQPQ